MTPMILLPIRSAAEFQWWIQNGPFFGFRGRFAVSFRNDRDEAVSFEAARAGTDDGVPIVAAVLTPCVLGDEVNRAATAKA